MVALVTGHRGFLGGQAHAALTAAGWEVVGAGRPDAEIPSNAFRELVERATPEVVVHCAGPASVPAAEADQDADRAGSVDVLAALLDALPPAARIVLVSSAAVYGNPPSLPVGSDAPLQPISAYGRNRVACERLLLESGRPAAIARVFSAYGEGLRRQVWWDIVRRAAVEAEVVLQGTGTESRDFVHGEDVGRALAVIAARAAFAGEAYNVGTETETTIAALAAALVNRLEAHVPVRFTGETRSGDPLRWRADIAPLRRLGFEPQVELAEGVDRYVRWAVQ